MTGNKRKIYKILLPILFFVGVVMGLLLGKYVFDKPISPRQEKLESILSMIENEYVDDVDIDSIMEQMYPKLLSMLDPHSAYIPASELTAVNEDLDGSFSGVGVSFQILNDTVTVIEVVPGGPSEKVGILAGDKILKADTLDLTGKNATTENVYKHLRGKEGSTVVLKIERSNSSKPLEYSIVRGPVPVNSVDCSYMLTDNIGYVKVSKFARNTYNEFITALRELQSTGADKYVIDLRGNSGGYMDQAILMVNEFLDAGRMIVFTNGKRKDMESYTFADGEGSFKQAEVTVITDEFSASASEIFSGAIQDNDRGLVIGRRSFGKGLVQNQTTLPDSSAVRLTVARYYTPSGRSIQKEYKLGDADRYETDILDRYNHGEFYHSDSIKLDKSKIFKTTTGRVVYGGGGIMPDVFVPEDTTGITSYYAAVSNAGLINKYAYKVAANYRNVLRNAKSVEQIKKSLPRDNTLLEGFVNYAVENGVPARWYYIRRSQDLILRQLKAVIVRDILGYSAFIQMLNESDNSVLRAVEILENGESPTLIKPDIKATKK
ncbi:MAG: S41 family peptidase [Muribaculaceae bacterium]|nr:S41 family peptidase [Muribaculaceae bacterium]